MSWAEDAVRHEDTSAQVSVIGSMLIEPRCIGGVVAKLRGEDFLDASCRNAFEVIRKLFLAGQKVDPVIVLHELGGGAERKAWLRQVLELTPTAANVAEYAELVRQQAALSRLRDRAELLLQERTLEGAVQLVREMSGLSTEAGRERTVTAAELAAGFMDRLGQTEKPEFLNWGIPTLDRQTYAEPGDYIVLGGYPSAGKTLLSIQMALCQARRRRVVYYELETQPEKMADRLFSHMAKLPLPSIKEHRLSDSQIMQAAQAAARFAEECPIDFVQAAGFTAEDVAADAISKGAEVIYIDYLQLLEGGSDRDSAYQRVSRASRSLKLFAQRHKVAVVALAQLNRPEKAGKAGAGKPVPPNMHSLRESGQIEQDADVIFLLWTADETDNDGSRRTLKIGKNKEGRRKTVELHFQGEVQTMTELEERPDTSVAAHYAAQGRAIKAANRAKTEQLSFEEENPFRRE